jgi:hypothetical protein
MSAQEFSKESLVRAIKSSGCLEVTSRRGDQYIDFSSILSLPRQRVAIVNELEALARRSGGRFSKLASTPTPPSEGLTALLSHNLDKGQLALRMNNELYTVHGQYANETVLLFDPAPRTSATVLDSARALRKSGLVVNNVLAIFDLGMGARTALEAEDLTLIAGAGFQDL